MTGFIQDGPSLGNQFIEDTLLQEYIRFRVPEEYRGEVERDLERTAGDLWSLDRKAETNLPVHIPFDPWGKRIDAVEMDASWQKLHATSAEEGIVAIGYERKQKEFSRLYQFAKLYMYHPSSAFYTCPLAMTDGAARMIEIYGDEALKKNTLQNLTSRDPSQFWTSGQWMTEKTGGSDVSQTETVAKKDGDQYRLYGVKWFSSATTADIAMALARIEGASENSKGLSVFYIELRDQKRKLQNISINRLKDKLGTKALPTVELTLDGTPAKLIGKAGEGVATIASLFNVTRLYNSMCALGTMRRGIALAQSYSKVREVFRVKLEQQPLHIETLAELQLELTGSFHLAMHSSLLLGKEEMGTATEEESALLRILTPTAKLFTGKRAVQIASEVVECFGGAGYVEDTGIPVLLRNSQVFPIWEGTTNILSLDVLRAMQKEHAFTPFVKDVKTRLERVDTQVLSSEREKCFAVLGDLVNFAEQASKEGVETMQAGARRFAFAVGELFAASLLLEFANWQLSSSNARLDSARAEDVHKSRSMAVAKRWVAKIRFDTRLPTQQWRKDSIAIASFE